MAIGLHRDPHRDVLEAALQLASGNVGSLKKRAEALYAARRGMGADEAVARACHGCMRLGAAAGANVVRLAQETIPLFAGLFMWARDGFPSFSLSPDFFHAVAVTDFGDPSDDPLYMPFDAFMVSFPKSVHFGEATHAFVCKIPSVNGTMTGREQDYTEHGFEIRWGMYRASLLNSDPVFTQWAIGATRRQIVEHDSALNRSVRDGMKGPYFTRPIDPDEAPLLSRLRRLLLNVTSYIEAAGPLPAQKREKNAAPAAVEKTHKHAPLFDVGRCVKLDGRIRAALTESAGDSSGHKWTLAQRFIVRGHWRNQAVGPGRTQRKRVWIEPFWKGPENVVEALSRTYEVSL
jgi:hypothetical protein